MHIVVLGAGVIGVTSAWYLAEAGHRVTVVERNSSAGHGTSYANAAQISPAMSSPWAFPGLVRKAISWAFAQNPPLVLGGLPDPAMIRFLWRMWRASSAEQYAVSKRRMVELAEYSRDCVDQLRGEIGIDYAGLQAGLIVAFREESQAEGYRGDLAVLDELKVPYRRLRADDVFELEPNLSRQSGIVGGVQLQTDQTGDCFRFTQALAAECEKRGVRFVYGAEAKRLVTEGERVRAVVTETETIDADAVVVALGVWSNALLKPHGIDLPIYPVKGYSLTVAADPDALGPRSTVSDETLKVGITNLRDRIRVGGTAELHGFDLSRPEHRYAGLIRSLRELFPRVPDAAIASAERWSGLRPVTPDGPPRIGPMRYRNLYLNSGHGTLGWTMACGSGRALADLISDRRGAVDLAFFAPDRR